MCALCVLRYPKNCNDDSKSGENYPINSQQSPKSEEFSKEILKSLKGLEAPRNNSELFGASETNPGKSISNNSNMNEYGFYSQRANAIFEKSGSNGNGVGLSSPFKSTRQPSFSRSSKNEATPAPTMVRSTLDVRSSSIMLSSNQTVDSLTPRVSPKFHFDECMAPYCTPPQSPPPQPRRRMRNSALDTNKGRAKEMGKHMHSTSARVTPNLK